MKETETILAKAPRPPGAAQTDAAKNFQTTPNTGRIPSPMGFPAFARLISD